MNKLKTGIFIFVITLIFIFVFFLTYNLAEPKAYDFMTKHVLAKKLPFDKYKKVYGSDDILLVVIDAKTVEKYRWPWKREVNCKIFDYLYINKQKCGIDLIVYPVFYCLVNILIIR